MRDPRIAATVYIYVRIIHGVSVALHRRQDRAGGDPVGPSRSRCTQATSDPSQSRAWRVLQRIVTRNAAASRQPIVARKHLGNRRLRDPDSVAGHPCVAVHILRRVPQRTAVALHGSARWPVRTSSGRGGCATRIERTIVDAHTRSACAGRCVYVRRMLFVVHATKNPSYSCPVGTLPGCTRVQVRHDSGACAATCGTLSMKMGINATVSSFWSCAFCFQMRAWATIVHRKHWEFYETISRKTCCCWRDA
jgi:hypothetical protein